MSDTKLTHVDEFDASSCRSLSEALGMVTAVLRGRTLPARHVRAVGPQASPAEGLALLESFTAIDDPHLRQALLDATAALAGGRSG